jgi:hypothetical protein
VARHAAAEVAGRHGQLVEVRRQGVAEGEGHRESILSARCALVARRETR